jgi:hypothetical protein
MIVPIMGVWEMVMRVSDRLVPVSVSMPSARRDACIVFMLVVDPCGQDLPGRGHPVAACGSSRWEWWPGAESNHRYADFPARASSATSALARRTKAIKAGPLFPEVMDL